MAYVSSSASAAPQCSTVRVAMLNADTTTPNTYAHMGTFGDILHHVLSTAAARRLAARPPTYQQQPNVHLEHAVFDVVQGEYPSSPADFDAFVITASAASAVDGTSSTSSSWIQVLEDYVVLLHERYPGARLFGSCFGHHIVCRALLGGRRHGVLRVEKNPRGWEIGVSRVYFTDEFREVLEESDTKRVTGRRSIYGRGRLPSPEEEDQVPSSMRLQFVHEDEVVLQGDLPRPWVLVGATEHCGIQGVYLAGRVLTLQGHFEFGKFEKRETRRIFGAGEGEQEGDEEEDDDDDGEVMAEVVLRFVAGELDKTRDGVGSGGSMMLTPRSSMEL